MDSRDRQALDWLAAHRDQIQYGIDSSGIWACERDSLEDGIRFDTYEQAARYFGWQGPENKLGRDTSTAEGRELWAEVDRAVANVASWPAWKRWPHPSDPTDPCPDPLFAAHLRTLEARERVLDPQPSPSDDEPTCHGCGGYDEDVCTCFRSYEDWEMLSCGE